MTRPVHLVVGIIGGMGPDATVELMHRVIRRTPADDDQDHIHVVAESNPKIPSRIAHLLEGADADPTSELVRIARNLEAAGATLLAMPCNTAHAYADAIRGAVTIPMLDMVALTAARAQVAAPGARIGLLASSAVHRTGLYAAAVAPLGMSIVTPHQQDALMELIRAVKRGAAGTRERASLGAVAAELAARSDALVIACTELSVIGAGIAGIAPVLDSLDVLADAIVAASVAAVR